MSYAKGHRRKIYDRHVELAGFSVGERVMVKGFGAGTVTAIESQYMLSVTLDKAPPVDFSVENPCSLLAEWCEKIEN